MNNFNMYRHIGTHISHMGDICVVKKSLQSWFTVGNISMNLFYILYVYIGIYTHKYFLTPVTLVVTNPSWLQFWGMKYTT